MRFVDYKCNDCENICEVVTKCCDDSNENEIKCVNCGSSNMVRIFAPVSFKDSGGNGSDYAPSPSTSSKSCSGGSCASCSGGCHH